LETQLKEGIVNSDDWVFIDVGGATRQRRVWAEYFEDVQTIMFLAPVSTFDQKMEEDRKKYRLEDTFALWNELCNNKLLKGKQIILFMNKVDVLAKKLQEGLVFQHHIKSYTGPNTVAGICSYLQSKFKKEFKGRPEKLKTFTTSIIDQVDTRKIFVEVRESIMRNNFSGAYMT